MKALNRCIVILVFTVASHASIAVHTVYKNSYDTIPSYLNNGIECVSLPYFCKVVGVAWKWNMYSEQFKIGSGKDTIILFQDNNFLNLNDSTVQIPYPPVRYKGDIYLDAGSAAELFSCFKDFSITWDKKEKLIEVAKKSDENRASAKEDSVKVSSNKEMKKSEKPLVKEQDTQAEAPAKAVDPPKQKLKVIVLDPGHGGQDPGAIGPTGMKEKDVTLAIGLHLKELLERNTVFSIHLTRSADVFVPLMQRTKFANEKKADLFISIHANSVSGNNEKKNITKGYKIYFLSQAKNEEDKLAAMIENSVIALEDDTKKGNYLQNILIDMANNEFLNESQDLSILVSETFENQLNGKIRPLQKGVGQANFWVLNGAYMPSILIETCFISNTYEEKLLGDPKIQKTIAVGIMDAINRFKRKYEAGS